MSYNYYANYGVGINVDKIRTTADKLRTFINSCPSLAKKFIDFDEDYENLSLEELMTDAKEIGDGEGNPYELAFIMEWVMVEKEDIHFVACDNEDGVNYLIYPESLPWDLSEKEKALTEDSLAKIFEKYVNQLTDQSLEELDYCHQGVVNGG